MKKNFILFILLSNLLVALPQAPEVASGEVSIHQEDFQTMMITASDKAIINYKQFNVEIAEKIQFIQPSNTSTVLNRVVGSNPSQILGNITSNGKVFLINPHGVYFGKEATVDTGSLIVSTLDILDQDFLEDRFSFRSKEGISGFIHNEGILSARDIALISSHIKNEGTICALLNKVVLASSEAVTLTFSSDGLMSFEIEESAKQGFIEHLGSIEANQVFIHLAQAKETIQNVINADGLIEGTVFTEENGKIRIAHQSRIKANSAFIEGSKVSVEGNIDVSSETTGGTIHILGDHLELRAAQIDASGVLGGGTVLIGGEYKGQGEIRTALTNFMDETSCIKANAYSEGDGGRVILWADDITIFNGTIFARGGEISGNGGFVETSGKETLGVLSGYVNTLAPHGKAGDWLLDPTTIVISSAGTATLVQAADCTNVSTGVTITAGTINAAASNVILCASVSITQNAAQTISLSAGVGITFQGSGSPITTTLNASVLSRGGAISFVNTAVILNADVQFNTTLSGASAGANINFDSTATIDGAFAAIFATGSAGVTSFGAAVGATTPLTNITFTSGARVDIGSNITVSGANPLSFAPPARLIGSSTITSNNASVFFNSTLDGAQVLTTVAGTGVVSFIGAVGSSTPLTNVIFTSTGGIAIRSSFAVSGANPLNFLQNLAVINTSGSITSNNANITFSAGLNTNNTTLTLTIAAGTGNVIFPVEVGIGGTLASIIFTSANTIQIGANISVAGTTTQTFSSPVILTSGVSISNSGSNITFSSTLDGAHALTLIAGTGTVTFSGAVGGTTPPTNLIFTSSGAIGIGANITVSGANPLTFAQAVRLTGTSTVTSNNANISFSSTINGANALTLVAGTGTVTFSGAIGGTTAPTNLTFTSSSGINVGASITVSGANPLTFPQVVSLTGASTITSNNANITFNTTLNGARALTIAGGSGTLTFTGAVGATTALTSLSATSATINQTLTATTTGALSYTGSTSIDLQGNITTSGGAITMTGPVTLTNAYTFDSTNAGGTAAGANINFSGSTSTVNFSVANTLTLRAGTGGIISFGGAVGGSTPPTNITFTSSSAIQVGASITVSGANPLTFPQAVVMTGTSTITSNNANISFSSTLNGAGALTIAGGSGTLTFTGAVGATTALTSLSATSATITQTLTAKTTGSLSYTGSTAINVQGSITTSSGAITMTGPVALTNTLTFDATNSGGSAGANISFSTTLNGASALTILGGTGTLTFTGAVGATTALTSLSATSATITQTSTAKTTGALSYTGSTSIALQGNITTSGGAITMTGPVTLTNAYTFDSTNAGGTAAGANINFSGSTSTVNFSVANTLTLRAGTGGIISFGGAVGGSTPPTNITFTSSSAIQVGASITVSGANPLVFPQAVVMTGTSTITSNNANITFNTTLNGAGALTIAGGSGTLTFTGAVGATTALTSLSATSATITQTLTAKTTGALSYTGSTSIALLGNITTSGGAITMTGPVTLTNAYTFDSTNAGGTAAGANINFSGSTSTVNFSVANTLTLRAGTGGVISFEGAVGGSTPPTNITFTSSSSIQVGASITVSGANPLVFAQAVVMTGTSTVTSNNANISFSSTINGANALTLVAGTGTVTFSGAIGGTTALTNLTFTSSSGINVGASITVSGANPLTFPQVVSLTGASTITSNNANITFNTTLNGANALTIAGGTGTLTFTGAVGATTALTSLSATSATITQTSTAKTTGALSYTGSTSIDLQGNITTSGGAITMTGPVTLTNAYTFDSTNAGGTAAGANINFSGSTSTVNFSVASTLTLRAGTGGIISFGGAVGGSTPPTNITFTSSSSIQVGASITVSGANPLTFPQAVVMTGTSTITSNNANISFSSPLNGAGALTIAGGSGTLTFTGAVGATTALTSLSATSATITQTLTAKTTGALSYTGSTSIALLGNITTSGGAITMTGPVTLTNAYTFDSTNAGGTAAGANINFSGSTTTVNFSVANTLTLTAGTGGVISFGGIVGGSTPPTNITFTSASLIQIGANITVTGANPLVFAQAVDLTAASNITSNNANITFSSTLDGAQALTLTAGTGTVTLSGAVGGTTPLTNITFASSGGINIAANITVSGANPLVFGQAVSLTGPSTITANNANITFSSTLDGAQAFTISAGSGTLTFTGAVGATTALTSLSGSGSTVTQTLTATTTGALSYTGSTSIALLGNITTSGGAITMTGPVTLTNALTFDSTNAGGTAAGANIDFSGSTTTVNFSVANTLTLTAGTGGVISFGGIVGGSTPPTNITFTSASLIQIGANITVTGANPLTFPDPVSLTAASNITSNNANITFSSTLDGAQALTLTAGTGTVTLSAAVGGTTPLTNITFASSGGINIAANITVSGANPLVFGQAVSLIGPSTITANNANITFSSTLDGAQDFTISAGSGTLTFTGAVGATTALTSLSGSGSTVTQTLTATTTGALSYTGSTSIALLGNITTSGGAITMTGPVVLTNALTFDSTNAGVTAAGANIDFSGSTTTIDFSVANTLTFIAGTGGVISFEGIVGGSTPPTNIIFTSASLIQVGANITVSGANPLVFAQAVDLTAVSNITSNNANITFSSTLDGAQDLTLTAGTGTVTFSGAVGGTTPLTNIIFASSGGINIAADITVSGANPLVFAQAVSLTGPSTITANNANITFSSTLDGAQAFTISAGSGTLTFTGAVGATTALTSLSGSGSTVTQTLTATTTGALSYTGSTSIALQGNITTSGGAITMTGPVVLTNALTFDSTNAGGTAAGANINFSGSTTTIDFSVANTLTLRAGTGGVISFEGIVGGSTPPTNITFTSSSSIQVGASITVSGANPLVFAQAVDLTAASNITSNNANITFSSTLDGAQALILAGGTGTLTFTGAVGGTIPLTSLVATSNVITQSSTLEASGSVTYTNTGLTTIAGAISVGSFTQNGGGSTLLEANLNATSTIFFTDPVTFNTAVSLTAPSGITLDTMIPTANGVYNLTLSAVSGSITATQLGSPSEYINVLTMTALSLSTPLIYANNVIINGSTTIAANIIAPGAQLEFTVPVTVASGTFIIDVTGGASAGSITFDSTLDGPGGLNFIVGTGDLVFTGDVGSITAFGNATVTSAQNVTVSQSFTGSSFTQVAGSGTTTIAGTMTTSSSTGISLTGNIFNITGSIITSDSGPVSFDNAGLLTLANTISSNGPVSQTGGGDVHLASSITTTNGAADLASVFFTSPITLTSAVTINTSIGGGNVTFGSLSTINGAEDLSFALGAGTVAFSAAVGGTTPLTNLIFTSAGLIEIGSAITVTGANPLIFSEPVSLTVASVILSNNADITFSSTLDGSHSLTLSGGTGAVIFSGAVGSSRSLRDLTVTSAVITQSSTMTASGTITYTNTGLATISETVSTGSFIQNGGGTVLLEASMIATSSILFTNQIIFDVSIFMAAAGTGGITLLSQMAPSSSGVYDLTLSAQAGAITAVQLGSALEYINTLTLTARSLSVGSIYANTVIDNGTETINSNIIAPGAYLLFPRATTVEAGTFTIDISGGSHTGAVRFYSTLDGPGGLIFIMGSGNLTFDGSIGGIVPFGSATVTSAQNVKISKDFTGSSFVQTAGTGTTTIGGTMKTSSSTGISLTGNIFNITGPIITTASGPVSFDNTGFLILSNSITSDGPVSQTDSGTVQLGNTITTTNTIAALASISFTDPVTLTDSVVMNTSIGGGSITFGASATINGLQNISFIAGSGNISLSGEIGGLIPIKALTFYSATDITLPVITASSLLQASGTGTTTLQGLVTVTGDSGVVLVGNIFDVNASIETFGLGSIILQNSGLFTLNTGATIDAAGIFIQTGTGGSGLYGNIESE